MREILMECIGCREKKMFQEGTTLLVCARCQEFEKKKRSQFEKDEEEIFQKKHRPKLKKEKELNICPLCRYIGVAMESHHVDGRKNSDKTIRICANCHREIHRGARIPGELS